ncbi:ankyrin repeat-containing domain protein [Xylaria venustula]|nr:ankyrin repeat-containing domain protein [Xylaria venustula]
MVLALRPLSLEKLALMAQLPEEHRSDMNMLQNFTPLHFAAYEGIGSLVKTSVDRGDSINEADSNNCTPLMWAAKNGFPDVVELLLKSGADQGLCTPRGLTAVFWASTNGNYRSLEKLIQNGGRVRVRDQSDCTPVYYAAAHGHIKTLGILITAGADVEAIHSSRTLLQTATYCGELAVVKSCSNTMQISGSRTKKVARCSI